MKRILFFLGVNFNLTSFIGNLLTIIKIELNLIIEFSVVKAGNWLYWIREMNSLNDVGGTLSEEMQEGPISEPSRLRVEDGAQEKMFSRAPSR